MNQVISLIEKYFGPKVSAALASLLVYLTGQQDLAGAGVALTDWISGAATDNTLVAGVIGLFVYLTRRARTDNPAPVPTDFEPDHAPKPPVVAAPDRLDHRPIGLRQNNPLNIEATVGDATRWRGEVGSENRYAQFSDMHYGVRAALYLLRNSYFRRHGLSTVLAIVNRWAPAMDANPTKKYAEYVANRMGVKNVATVIDLNNDYVLIEMFKAMAFFELGQEARIPTETMREALNDI